MRLRVIIWFVSAFCPMQIALAQTGSIPDTPTLQALLTEVRQLRLTLERTMVVWPQLQVVLQRTALQQQRVENLSRQMEQVRDQRARTAEQDSGLAAEIKRSEARLPDEQDPRRRKELEDNIRRFKAMLEERAARDQPQQARESQLDSQLQSERARLNEFNDRLDALERALQAAVSSK